MDFMLKVEKKNNPERKIEALQRKERLDTYKEKLDKQMGEREKEVKDELKHID